MTTYACPKGHASETDDFCDTCGAKIGAATPLPSRVAPSGGSAHGGHAGGTAHGTGNGGGPADASGPAGGGYGPAGGVGNVAAGVGNGVAGGARPGSATGPAGGPADGGAASVLAGTSGSPNGGAPCPNCGMPRAGTGRFCEDCGYDHHTGKVPALTPVAAPATAAAPWTATIAADRAYFEANGIEGVDFPDHTTTRTLDLPPPQVRIGRRSVTQGTDPDIDLRDDDPGVSHNQALLTLSIDGVWLLSDLGSTNGTYLNDEQKPVTAGHSRALKAGDRIHVGAWTTITLHAPAQS